MKRGREDSEETAPSSKRPRPSPDLEQAREKWELEKRALVAEAEKRALAKQFELEMKLKESEKREHEREKRALVKQFELEIKLKEAEKRVVEEKALAEKRENELEKLGLMAELGLARVQGIQAREEEKEEAPPRAKHRQFSWLRKPSWRLPGDILTHLTTFLRDDDRFRLRGVCFTFYAAYFNQKVVEDAGSWKPKHPFNAMRAICLAIRGRRFPNVGCLHVEGHGWKRRLTEARLEAIGPYSFPALTSLYLPHKKSFPPLVLLPSHPKLTNLCVWTKGEELLQLTDQRFPALKILHMNVSDLEPGHKQLAPHRGLEELRFTRGSPNWTAIEKKLLPSLKRVAVCDGEEIPDEHRSRLKSQGVEMTRFSLEN